jgi:His/Glu/Gln/Arg/opine family amino acid ABC transporter permease subunit
MGYNWQWDIALEWIPWLLVGIGNTILLAITSMVTGLALGVIVAMARISGPAWLRRLTMVYTEFFRNTPLLIQLVWVFYAIPIITGNITPAAFLAAWVALSLNLGAFLGEVVRAGVTAVGKGQWDAGRALGMSQSQVYRRIVLPIATIYVIPPIATYWVSLFRDTSLASVISVSELFFRARWAATITFQFLELYIMVGVIYFLATYPQARLADFIHRRVRLE